MKYIEINLPNQENILIHQRICLVQVTFPGDALKKKQKKTHTHTRTQ